MRRSLFAQMFFCVPVLLIACSSPNATPDASDVGADAVMDVVPVCHTDIDCTDHVFCNGAERCMPGAVGANAMGCLPPSAPACTSGQTCNEAMMRCETGCGATPDADHDGHRSIACGGDDCDDNDANRFPGNAEVCTTTMATGGDGGTLLMRVDPTHDEDCDPTTFANAASHDGDHDGDGYVDHACCNTDRSGMTLCGTDCQDLAEVMGMPASMMTIVAPGDIHPMESEVCDGVDNNCNGVVDEGATLNFYPDCDGDGFGDRTATPMPGCRAQQFATCMGHAPVTDHTDCNDAIASINPGTPEVCDVAMVDENCNGMRNEGCTCVMDVPCGSTLPGCPGGIEPCVAGHLQSCSVTPVILTCYADTDDDGYALPGAASSMACSCPMHTTSRAPSSVVGPGNTTTDCDDSLSPGAAVHPGATEGCNGLDDNCNGRIDDGPSMDCTSGSSVSILTCGIPCSQPCNSATCQHSCQCTLASSTWTWPGDSAVFSHTAPPFGCPGAPDLSGTNWWWYTGAGAECDLEVGPASPALMLPAGDYTASVWLSGNVHGEVLVKDAIASATIGSPSTFLLGPGGNGWVDMGGFNVVSVLFTVTHCTTVWIDVHLFANATGHTTCAIASTNIARNSNIVTNTQDSLVVCP